MNDQIRLAYLNAAVALDVLFANDTAATRRAAAGALETVRDVVGSFDAQIQREHVFGTYGGVDPGAWATWAHGWRVKAEADAPHVPF